MNLFIINPSEKYIIPPKHIAPKKLLRRFIKNTLPKQCKIATKENVPMIGAIEEESLKLSIAVGTYEWHSINGESIEL